MKSYVLFKIFMPLIQFTLRKKLKMLKGNYFQLAKCNHIYYLEIIP
jgi:hypothetical protein